MTKPHEETLTVRKTGHEYRVVREDGADDPLRRSSLAMVYTPGPNDDPEVATYADGEALAIARAQQFAAAPDMARALRVVLQAGVNSSWVDDETGERVDMQKVARAALTKAGVPLP